MTSVTSSEVKLIIVIRKTRPSDYKMGRRGHLPGSHASKCMINIWYQLNRVLVSTVEMILFIHSFIHLFTYFSWMMYSTNAFHWHTCNTVQKKITVYTSANPPPKQLHADSGQMMWAASFDFNWKTKPRQREPHSPRTVSPPLRKRFTISKSLANYNCIVF